MGKREFSRCGSIETARFQRVKRREIPGIPTGNKYKFLENMKYGHRVAGIIIKDGKILLMHRRKMEKDYYVIPGGSIEEGEKPEIALIREIKEETGLDAEIGLQFFDFESAFFKRHEYFFMIRNISGEEKIGEPERSRQRENNQYSLEWIQVERIAEVNLLPPELKEKLIETFCKNDPTRVPHCDM